MLIRRFLRDLDGQTTIVAAVCMTAMLSFVGLAVDVGHLRYVKRSLQVAVDAAALSAALEFTTCGSTADCNAMQTAAIAAMAENGFTGLSATASCSNPSGSATVLIVNNAPCILGSADPNNGKATVVEVIFAQPQTTYFARVLGFNNIPVEVRAEAQRSPAPCVWALDRTGANAITADALAAVTASCPIVDESSSSSAMSCALLAAINAPVIHVVGGIQQLLCGVTTTPTTGVRVPTPADPLAYLPKPSVPACGTSTASPYHGSPTTVIIAGNATLYPDGAYCGGITILPTANVTFKPGTYVLTSSNVALLSSGGLAINALSTVSGSGVTFYNYGPSGGVTFPLTSVSLGGVNLVAPTTGTYAGILFFQDPGNTSAATLLGSSSLNTQLVGAYYFPSAAVNYLVSGSNAYNILVAKDVHFAVLSLGLTSYEQSVFNNNYSTLPGGSPINSSGAVLVQ